MRIKSNMIKNLRRTRRYVAFLISIFPIPLSATHQNGPESEAVAFNTVNSRVPILDPSELIFESKVGSCVFTDLIPDVSANAFDITDCPEPGNPLVVLVFDFISYPGSKRFQLMVLSVKGFASTLHSKWAGCPSPTKTV